MKEITIKEFKDMSNIDIINKLLEINKGYITAKQITNLGIHRTYLKIMLDRNLIKKVGSGVYTDNNVTPDPYYILSLIIPNIVYSHQTSLYLHGFLYETDTSKESFDITTKKEYHNPTLVKHQVFRVPNNIFEIGLNDVMTPFGNMVKAYDVERSICDIVKYRKKMNTDYIKHSLRKYLEWKGKDLVKLSRYAEKLGIKDELFEILNWMS